MQAIKIKELVYAGTDTHREKIIKNDFWQNRIEAQKVLKEKKLHEDLINSYEDVVNAKDDNFKSYITLI